MLEVLAKLWKGVKGVLRILLPFSTTRWEKRVKFGGEEVAAKMLGGKKAGKAPEAGQEAGKEAGKAARGGIGFLGILHFLLVIAILVGLYIVGWKTKLFGLVRTDPQFYGFYLPALALLLYGLLWLGWYLWKLLSAEEEASPYPDIDAAWKEAMQILQDKGLDVKSAPLFLVLGKPAGTEEALFDASGQRLMVRRAPADVTAPLHVYAGPDAIFVTCAGASLLGNLADILAGVKEPAMDGELDGSPSIVLGGGTRLPNENFRKMQRILRNASGRKLSDDERRELGKLCARDEARQGYMIDRAKQSLLKDPHKVAESAARLRRACQLVARERRPFCSVNGLLFLVPVSGAASDSDASLTGDICQRDYAEARATLQVDCPVFAMVCDVETVPGFREFRAGFAEEELAGRVGQRYPLVPDLRDDEIPASLDEAISWIGDATIPGWIYKFFQVDKGASREESAEALHKNARLYQFLGTMRERIHRLSKVLTHGLLDQKDHRPLFAGCYIAGTGRADTDQAFGAGVFRRLVGEQDNVAWTQQALQQEAEYQRLLGIGYAALGALAVLNVVLAIVAVMVRKL